MMRINLVRIVRIFSLFFICFVSQSAANLMTVIQMQAISGGHAFIRAQPGSTVEFLGRNFAVDEQGFAAIGFGRDVAGLHELIVKDERGNQHSEMIWIETRDYAVQRIEGVDMSRVTPPDTVTERIVKEARMVTRARASQSRLDHWREDLFQWPLEGRITGVYGSQRFYNGIARSPHWGIDLAARSGETVRAPAGGIIVLAEPDLYFSGGTIVLDHGGGLTSSFLHLSKISVALGQAVQQGEKIAEVGSTGRSTGPHLDWRMNLHGERIDAALWIK